VEPPKPFSSSPSNQWLPFLSFSSTSFLAHSDVVVRLAAEAPADFESEELEEPLPDEPEPFERLSLPRSSSPPPVRGVPRGSRRRRVHRRARGQNFGPTRIAADLGDRQTPVTTGLQCRR
jgi:hypothetical protein